MDKLKRDLMVKEDIAKVRNIKIKTGVEDRLRWTISKDGDFNTKDTWNESRQEGEKTYIFGRIWNNITPKKCSFLLWRLMKGWIPIDSTMKQRKIPLVSKCQFCEVEENLNHVFVECTVAWETWRYFAGLFGLFISKNMTLNHIIRTWYTSRRKKVHMRTIIPSIIVWAVWQMRNGAKHEGKRGSSLVVVEHCRHLISLLDRSGLIRRKHWMRDEIRSSDLQCFSHLKEPVGVSILIWSKPEIHGFKLNTDGTCLFSGDAGGGGVIRDEEGNIVHAFTRIYGKQTPLLSECRALLDGLWMSWNNNIPNLCVEVDSYVLYSMIIKAQAPWFMKGLIESCIYMLEKCKAKISHIRREQNQAADFIAKHGLQERRNIDFSHVDVPIRLKSICLLESTEMGYIRVGNGF